MRIVFVSHSAFDENFVVGSHHLARALAHQGHAVLHISSPVSPLHFLRWRDKRTGTRLRRCMQGPRQLGPGLWEWIPLAMLPWQAARRLDIAAHNRFLPPGWKTGRMLEQAQFSEVDLVVMDEPRMVGIEQQLNAKRSIYRATDLYAQLKGDDQYARAERILAMRVDAMVGTSQPVCSYLQSLGAETSVRCIKNGVDLRHFSKPAAEDPSLHGITGPRVVYVGAIDQRFDWSAVHALAMNRPDLSVLIYGPVETRVPRKPPGESSSASSPSNLRLMGPIPYSRLPAVLQHCQIGIIPTNKHPSNAARSPMKFYEYAAAGLPVVARWTPELETRGETFMHLYRHAREMPGCIDSALSAGGVESATLQAHGWDHKARQLLEIGQSNTKPLECVLCPVSD